MEAVKYYPRQPRLSFEALEIFLEGIDLDIRKYNSGAEHLVMNSAIANRIGRPRASVNRWRHEDIPLYTADAIAIRLGVHPIVIWPDFHHTREEQLCPT